MKKLEEQETDQCDPGDEEQKEMDAESEDSELEAEKLAMEEANKALEMNIELEKVPHPNLPYGDIKEGAEAIIKKSETKLDKDGKEKK
jgi:hypothetical protein